MAAAYPDINTGSSLLAARGNVVAQMAQVQNQANENVAKSLQGISDTLLKHQDAINKQKADKEDRDFRAATFAEQQRANKANEDLKQKSLELEKENLGIKGKLSKAQIADMYAGAGLKNQQKKWGDDFANREAEEIARQKAEKEKLEAERIAAEKAKATKQDNNIVAIEEAKATDVLSKIPVVNLIKKGIYDPIVNAKVTK